VSVAPNWLWLIGGVLLGAAEALAPGVFLIWIGLAAVATGLLGFVLPLGLEWSLVAFCGFAVIAVLLGKAIYGSRQVASDRPFLNRRAEALIGRLFMLEEPITQGMGRVRVDDSVWRVSGPDLPAGACVRVVAVERAVILRVEAA